MSAGVLVRAAGIVKRFGGGRRAGGETVAIDGVDVEILTGETLGLVGESGSGKSTLGRVLLRLVECDEGTVEFEGRRIDALGRTALRALRPRMQIVFQNPYAALNPRLSVHDVIVFNLLAAGVEKRDRDRRVGEALRLVGLGAEFRDRRPHQLSGGQAQRVGIARALVTEPRFLVADEVVSALDVSVQAEILALLADLRERLSLTTLFISHNLEVVRAVSDRIAVMHRGRIVEQAAPDALHKDPRHPYTRLLLDAIPGEAQGPLSQRAARRQELRRAVDELAGAPLRTVADGHLAAVHP